MMAVGYEYGEPVVPEYGEPAVPIEDNGAGPYIPEGPVPTQIAGIPDFTDEGILEPEVPEEPPVVPPLVWCIRTNF